MIMRRTVRWLPALTSALVLLVWLGANLFGQTEGLPPKPDRYVTDNAGVLDAGTIDAINTQLEQFEKDTSNQLVVAIYPSLPADAEIAQYASQIYDAWGVGQKGKDNGVILFVFVNDHKMFIATSRGLNGALPDATCKRIIDQVISPAFRQGDFAGGVQAGVNAIIAATKGEFKGNGSTVAERNDSQSIPWGIIIIFIIIVLISLRSGGGAGPVIFTSGGWGGGYGGGGGGFSGGGGGGFSGGGGSSDGGGAGGSW
jgi:uncharacterized protein